MNSLTIYLSQASACLVVFYGFYHLVLRKETCFQFNRAYLLLTPALAWLLPLLPQPAWLQTLSFFPEEETASQVYVAVETGGYGEVLAAPPGTEQAPFPWQALVWSVYALGCCFCLYRFLRQLLRMAQLIRQHRGQILDQDGLLLVPTSGQLPTFSFFHYLFFNQGQHPQESERQKVLQHEAVHIRQKHSWDVLYMEVLKILFWFHPLPYLFQKALVSTHEYIADARVVKHTCPREYAQLLARQVLNQMDLSLGHFFNKSLTLKRLAMLHKTQLRPSRLKQGLTLPLLLLVFVLVSAGNKPAEEQPLASENLAALDQAKPESAHSPLAGRPETASRQSSGIMEKKRAPLGPSLNPSASSSPARQSPANPLPQQGTQGPDSPEGRAAISKFLRMNLKYPPQAIRNKISGQAIIEVVLDAQGKVNQVVALQADHEDLAREGIRALRLLPDQQPSAGSNKLSSRLIFPILFGLDSQEHVPALRLPDLRQPYSLQTTVTVIGFSTYPNNNQKLKPAAASPGSGSDFPRDSKIFTFVEQMARFPGGEAAMNKFIAENLRYPEASHKNKVEGLVVAQFVVDRNGKVLEPNIVKSLDPATDAEALRLIKSFPDFEPARQNGNPVELRYTLPIRFSLQPKNPGQGSISPNPASGNVVRLRPESEPAVGCEPRLVRETATGPDKHILTFHYRSPGGCPGETFEIESMRYSHMRGKQDLTGQIQVAGNKIDIAKILESSQPGDQLMVMMKGKSISANGKPTPPINAGTVIVLK
ncbi:MAG: TonB family protein [Adhaeribacter sp.]